MMGFTPNLHNDEPLSLRRVAKKQTRAIGNFLTVHLLNLTYTDYAKVHLLHAMVCNKQCCSYRCIAEIAIITTQAYNTFKHDYNYLNK